MKNYWVHHFILLLLISMHIQNYGWCTRTQHPHFIIIVPSYNNIEWYTQNLNSLFSQDYKDFHIIYIDDCSTDGTAQAVEEYLHTHNVWDKITFIKSDKRRGALANIYNAVHLCNNTDIILIVDGDDWLAHEQVLSHLATVYKNEHIWMTFGQFVGFPSGTIGHCRPLAKQHIVNNTFRDEPCFASHLRTFYAWLFKKINRNDLLFRGQFYPMTWDWAFLYPMLEMAGDHVHFIPEVLYIYNQQNPISDCKKNATLQWQLGNHIRELQPYERL